MHHPTVHSLLGAMLFGCCLPALAELPAAPAYINDSGYPEVAKQRILPPMFEQKLSSTRFIMTTTR
jgi:hypothetical protein